MKGAWIAMAVLAACNGNGVVPSRGPAAGRAELIQENRDAVKLEDRDIDLYLKRLGIEAVRSGTGVRYRMLRDSTGPTARPEERVALNYRMELLNGDSLQASLPGRPESFRVAHDQVESGLHEAVQFLSEGDSALVIIPSYRAHGLAGDLDKVPPRSTVVYRLGVVSIKAHE
jgi:FKBP-type peptidyl-prolyl cis-trans isomerase